MLSGRSPLPVRALTTDVAEGSRRSIYYPGLDTLRGFFALTVVFFHFYLLQLLIQPQASYGALFTLGGMGAFGVPFFFVLSSFLITDLLLEEKARTGTVAILPFYGRRILRVWPVYFAAFIVGFTVVDRLAGVGDTRQWILWFVFFVANNVMAGQQIGAPPMTYAPLWSVSIEEQFYFVWPWVMRFIHERVLAWIGGGLILAALVARNWRFDMVTTSHSGMWFHTSSHLDCFGCGVLACLLHRKGLGRPLYPFLGWIAVGVAVLLVAIQETTGTLVRQPELLRIGIYAYSLVPVLAGLLILACAQPAESLHGFWKNPVGLWVGRISYGIYAYHGFGIQLLEKSVRKDVGHIALAFLELLAMTFGCATASFYLLERPALNLKSRLQKVRSGKLS